MLGVRNLNIYMPKLASPVGEIEMIYIFIFSTQDLNTMQLSIVNRRRDWAVCPFFSYEFMHIRRYDETRVLQPQGIRIILIFNSYD